ncbi:MAG: hypothetical protein R6X02_03980 [Enhygromyxa sp.]
MAESLDLDDLEGRFRRVVSSPVWEQLQSAFCSASRVYILGNGGNLLVAQHAASDISRLTSKHARAPGGAGLASALIQDDGYDHWLLAWLDGELRGLDPQTIAGVLTIGLSASGRSRNIFEALRWVGVRGAQTGLISGRVPTEPLPGIVVDLDARYYHSSECLSLMLAYQLIRSAGGESPRLPE